MRSAEKPAPLPMRNMPLRVRESGLAVKPQARLVWAAGDIAMRGDLNWPPLPHNCGIARTKNCPRGSPIAYG